jgi:microcystin-dependent protein
MSSPFVAEVRVFGFNFPPTGWAQCNGQLLPISQNTALFSLLGTYYGGDGKSTFGLPNLEGSMPIGQGQGGGLSDRFLGEQSGSETVTLIFSEMPNHPHGLFASNEPADVSTPTATVALARTNGQAGYAPSTGPQNSQLDQSAASVIGGDLPHNNLMPYLVLNYCIALQGVFPPRS